MSLVVRLVDRSLMTASVVPLMTATDTLPATPTLDAPAPAMASVRMTCLPDRSSGFNFTSSHSVSISSAPVVSARPAFFTLAFSLVCILSASLPSLTKVMNFSRSTILFSSSGVPSALGSVSSRLTTSSPTLVRVFLMKSSITVLNFSLSLLTMTVWSRPGMTVVTAASNLLHRNSTLLFLAFSRALGNTPLIRARMASPSMSLPLRPFWMVSSRMLPSSETAVWRISLPMFSIGTSVPLLKACLKSFQIFSVSPLPFSAANTPSPKAASTTAASFSLYSLSGMLKTYSFRFLILASQESLVKYVSGLMSSSFSRPVPSSRVVASSLTVLVTMPAMPPAILSLYLNRPISSNRLVILSVSSSRRRLISSASLLSPSSSSSSSSSVSCFTMARTSSALASTRASSTMARLLMFSTLMATATPTPMEPPVAEALALIRDSVRFRETTRTAPFMRF